MNLEDKSGVAALYRHLHPCAEMCFTYFPDSCRPNHRSTEPRLQKCLGEFLNNILQLWQEGADSRCRLAESCHWQCLSILLMHQIAPTNIYLTDDARIIQLESSVGVCLWAALGGSDPCFDRPRLLCNFVDVSFIWFAFKRANPLCAFWVCWISRKSDGSVSCFAACSGQVETLLPGQCDEIVTKLSQLLESDTRQLQSRQT